MNKKSPGVSCIIPAYNEEKTVAKIVKAVLSSDLVSETIVVNDGSRDRTLEKLSPFTKKIKIIDLPKNRGKGYAVYRGIKAATKPLILMLDADLINLEPHHLFSLINPVASDMTDMTIASFTSVRRPYDSFWPFCGQRCVKRRLLLPLLEKMKGTRYGLEVFLNDSFRHKRIVVVPLVSEKKLVLIKTDKDNDWIRGYIREVWQIFQQTISMRSKDYSRKAKEWFIKNLASYLRVSIKKIKDYLAEEI